MRVYCASAAKSQARQEPFFIFENVNSYSEKLLVLAFKSHDVHCTRFCPRQLGFAAARPRFYAIVINKERAMWNAPCSFEKLLQLLMAEPVMHAEEP
jgi:hypothetical protein